MTTEYGTVFVEPTPFVTTADVARTECRSGSTWVVFTDRGSEQLRRTTGELLAAGEPMAVFIDGGLASAPLIKAEIIGGEIMLLVDCDS